MSSKFPRFPGSVWTKVAKFGLTKTTQIAAAMVHNTIYLFIDVIRGVRNQHPVVFKTRLRATHSERNSLKQKKTEVKAKSRKARLINVSVEGLVQNTASK